MALEPGASVKSKYDLTRSRFEYRDSFALVPGTNLVAEGQLMIAGGAGAVQQAAVSAGAAGEVPLGVSLNASILGTTFTAFETFTVPAVPGPYTVQLGHTNLTTKIVTGTIPASAVTGTIANAYVETDTTGALAVSNVAPNAGEVQIVPLTGLMTFNVAQAGETGYVRYSWNLTVVEAQEILKQSAIGRGSDGTFEKIIVGRGHCRIFTTMFDCTADWTLNFQTDDTTLDDNSPVLGPGGIWTTSAQAALLNPISATPTPFGRVISLPTADDPYLGIEYHVAR